VYTLFSYNEANGNLGMKIGFIGLGKMGSQMVTRLANDHHDVVVYDMNADAARAITGRGVTPATDYADLARRLGDKPIVWLMIPAAAVDETLLRLTEVLPAGSIVIDGGNSDWRDTVDRANACDEKQVQLVDVGTSGGLMGLEHGFSMMVGGPVVAFQRIEPLIRSLAAKDGYKHFGATGSGHFIKMVHNGIEYGIMQSYAEGYNLLRETRDFPRLDLAAISDVWQHGSIISSSLNGMIGQVIKSSPELAGVDGYVAESGEGRWTLETAQSQGIEMPALEAALDVRTASQQGTTSFGTKLLAALRNTFGGHKVNKS
jgi:6-phosphogluconate dehydrogenase